MKSYFQALDGLRGTVALNVVMFHIWEWLVPDLAHNPMPHTFLAVDFFFALSGYSQASVKPVTLWETQSMSIGSPELAGNLKLASRLQITFKLSLIRRCIAASAVGASEAKIASATLLWSATLIVCSPLNCIVVRKLWRSAISTKLQCWA